MVRLAGVVVVLVAVAVVAAAESGPSCTTAVVARGCDRNPVSGVQVKLVTEGGRPVKGETDAGGRVEFDLCPEEIAKLKVGGVRAERANTATVVEETENLKLATITVGACESSRGAALPAGASRGRRDAVPTRSAGRNDLRGEPPEPEFVSEDRAAAGNGRGWTTWSQRSHACFPPCSW